MTLPPHYPPWWHVPAGLPRIVWEAGGYHLWRPIATAPKDGSHILACGTYQWEDYEERQQTGVVVVFWEVDLNEYIDDWKRRSGGWVLVNANPYTDRCQPTHWMPLPEGP